MPLEVANTIADLDEQWPNGNDGVDRGDDHIRMLKHVLKSTFPGPSPGNGFGVPLTVDPVLLNNLQATIDELKTSIKNANPVGSLVFRADNINPATLYPGTSWTLLYADACIALGNGNNGGVVYGNNSPSVPLPLHTHGSTMVANGAHEHMVLGVVGSYVKRADGGGNMDVPAGGVTGSPVSQAGLHDHALSIHESGVANPTIDVRGTRMYLNVWKRTA